MKPGEVVVTEQPGDPLAAPERGVADDGVEAWVGRVGEDLGEGQRPVERLAFDVACRARVLEVLLDQCGQLLGVAVADCDVEAQECFV